MVLLKSDKPNIRNVDLLNTYYSGNKTPAVKKKSGFVLTKFAPRRLWLILVLLLAAAGGAFIIARFIPSKSPEVIDVGKASSSLSAKDKAGDTYYKYEDIKDDFRSFTLDGNNHYAVINLGSAMDFSNAVISFGARGENGEEKLALILRDSKKMSNANPDDIILTTPLLKERWNFFRVNLKEISIPVDKSRVTQIRFDSSYRLTKNESGARVYIKDLSIE